MVESEKEPLCRGAHGRTAGPLLWSRASIAIASASVLIAIAVATSFWTTSQTGNAVALEENPVQLFKSALASQEADLARHRKREAKIRASADRHTSLTQQSKRERLSDARLFKDAVKEQHDELAKQRAAEATARDMARKNGELEPSQKGSMSDASLLKDALKEQSAEAKKMAKARIKIKAAAKVLKAKLEAEARLKSAKKNAAKKKETSDERLFEDALKEQHDENSQETAALKKDLIIAAKKTKEAWEKSKKARKEKISHELRAILGAQDTLAVKKKAPPQSKLLKDAIKEENEDKVKAEKAQAAQEKAEAKAHPAVPKHMIATSNSGHQVLSQSAEKTLVAYLLQADNKVRHKPSPAQLALGRELQAARMHKSVAPKAAAHGAAPKAAVH